MADSTDLNDIFKAMEEIDLLSENRKKDKEVLILDKEKKPEGVENFIPVQKNQDGSLKYSFDNIYQNKQLVSVAKDYYKNRDGESYNDKEAVKFGNALIDSTLIGLNPSRWHSWAFSHDSTLNYLDLRITMASSYFALAEFDSTQVHLKVVLDSLGSSTKLISDYKSLLGRQLVAHQLDSLQKVLQK